MTALHYAVAHNYDECVKLLLNHDECEINIGDINGQTAVDLAISDEPSPNGENRKHIIELIYERVKQHIEKGLYAYIVVHFKVIFINQSLHC